jgi:DNA mismatch endonuclease (patch repair protein)
MSRVRGKNTTPELVVRKLISSLGYRYRLHGRSLPGRPDIVFPSRKVAVFVHGCYWHRHTCFNGCRLPKSRLDFWRTKLEGNKARDRRNLRKLKALGWRVLVVWECQLKDLPRLSRRVVCAIEGTTNGRKTS